MKSDKIFIILGIIIFILFMSNCFFAFFYLIASDEAHYNLRWRDMLIFDRDRVKNEMGQQLSDLKAEIEVMKKECPSLNN